MNEKDSRKIGWKTLAALGLLFGLGFTAGFLSGFEYGFANRGTPPSLPRSEAASADAPPAPPDAAPSPDRTAQPDDEDELDEIENSEFDLTEHALGDDENGLFISGTVVNRSQSAFDAVRVAFELCDTKGVPYSTVSDLTGERMAPGDSWGFTIYIPYAEMGRFHSYRLQGIMGVRR